MDSGEIYNPRNITLSDKAVIRVKELLKDEGNNNLKLRVFITGGGCNGFEYGFTFDDKVNSDDAVITKMAVSLVIDALSYQYLVGAEIDYQSNLSGSKFKINNPNATTTCSCGNSFSV